MIHLKIHVESIHEGLRYPCDKCPYKATTISSLKRHGESIHEGVCYSCDHCENEYSFGVTANNAGGSSEMPLVDGCVGGCQPVDDDII